MKSKKPGSTDWNLLLGSSLKRLDFVASFQPLFYLKNYLLSEKLTRMVAAAVAAGFSSVIWAEETLCRGLLQQDEVPQEVDFARPLLATLFHLCQQSSEYRPGCHHANPSQILLQKTSRISNSENNREEKGSNDI